MTGFTDTFGGEPTFVNDLSFSSLVLSAAAELVWPTENQATTLLFTDVIEVESDGAYALTLPSALLGPLGASTIINNIGSYAIEIRSNSGSLVASVDPGEAWYIYLAGSQSAGGSWRSTQLGATVSTSTAAALSSSTLLSNSNTLNAAIFVQSGISTTPYTFSEDLFNERGKVWVWEGGVGVINLPTPNSGGGVSGGGWFIYLRNDGTGTITITPPGGTTIDGAASKTLAVGASVLIVRDGSEYYTIGSSSSGSGSSFDLLALSVAGSGNYTLAGVELNRIGYKLTGILTGTRTIIVPATVQQYWVDNSTTGAFNLYVKTAAQAAPGILVPQGDRTILYCDSNNVIDADTSTVTFPIPVASGGTGSTTAADARTALGVDAANLSIRRDGTGLPTAAQNWNGQDLTNAAKIVSNKDGGGTAAGLQVVSGTPGIRMNQSGATANAKEWDVIATAEQLQGRALNDANTLADNWLLVERLAQVIVRVTLGGSGGVVRFPNRSSDPVPASNGDVYYNTTTHKLRVWANTVWVDLH